MIGSSKNAAERSLNAASARSAVRLSYFVIFTDTGSLVGKVSSSAWSSFLSKFFLEFSGYLLSSFEPSWLKSARRLCLSPCFMGLLLHVLGWLRTTREKGSGYNTSAGLINLARRHT